MRILFDPQEVEATVGETATESVVDNTEGTVANENPDFRPALEAKLAKLMSDNAGEEQPVSSNGEKPATDETEEVKDEGGEPTEAVVTEVVDPSAPTLPDAYRRSLKAYGWEDEDIDQNLKVLGANFITTAGKIHANRNNEVQQWAEQGRQARDAQNPTQTPAAAPAKSGQLPSQLASVDARKLTELYGDEELVNAIVGPVNATIAAINLILPGLNDSMQKSQQSETQALVTEIETFFGSEPMKKGYGVLYGDGVNVNTAAQQANRNAVLDQAEAIIYGATRQGRTLTVSDALALAHDSVAAPFREQAIKANITRQAKDRNRGISVRPAAKGLKPTGDSKPQNRADLETKIGRMLAQMR